MMGMVHNVQYFYWFEQGRMQILEELMSLDASMKLGVVMPVVENQCLYQKARSLRGSVGAPHRTPLPEHLGGKNALLPFAGSSQTQD